MVVLADGHGAASGVFPVPVTPIAAPAIDASPDAPASARHGGSANNGVHHVHHLQSRVPFYRLPEILRDHSPLDEAQRLTFRESLRGVRLQLWDERGRRLVSFAEPKAI